MLKLNQKIVKNAIFTIFSQQILGDRLLLVNKKTILVICKLEPITIAN